MNREPTSISAAALTDTLQALFAGTGMQPDDATCCAEALVQTNLWGIDSHGVMRAPTYLRRLACGAVNPRPQISARHKAGAVTLLDGDNGMGFVVGRAAMAEAIALAQQHHLAAVGVTRSNHFGAAALYAQQATAAGLIGIVMTNVTPNVVAPGGSRPVIGNNPIAIGIPTFADFPFILDMSLSNAAGGKLLLASKKGEPIPADWATDADGRPTTDPDKAFAGFLLPVGGHKGLALAYVVDILCGVITGGAFQNEIKSMYKNPEDPSQTGHFMIALDPLVFLSQAAYQSRLGAFMNAIKTAPLWDDDQTMLIPGEKEFRTALIRRRTGIPIPATIRDELLELSIAAGLPAPF